MISLFSFPAFIAGTQQTNQITCTSPTSNTILHPGDEIYITWTADIAIGVIQIDIYKGNLLKYSLEPTSNDGSFLWRVPYSIELGSDWRIKIYDEGYEGTYDWSDYFEITMGGKLPIIILIIVISVAGFVGVISYIRRRNKREFKK